MCGGVCVCSVMSDFAVLWNVSCQAPLFMGFPGKKNTGVGCHLDYLIPKFAMFAPTNKVLFSFMKSLLKKNPVHQIME